MMIVGYHSPMSRVHGLLQVSKTQGERRKAVPGDSGHTVRNRLTNRSTVGHIVHMAKAIYTDTANGHVVLCGGHIRRDRFVLLASRDELFLQCLASLDEWREQAAIPMDLMYDVLGEYRDELESQMADLGPS